MIGRVGRLLTTGEPRGDAEGARPHPLARLLAADTPNGRRARLVLVTVAVVQALWSLGEAIRWLVTSKIYHKDFLAIYVLTRALAEGVDPFLPLDALARRFLEQLPVPVFPHPTPHPPTLGLLALLFSALPYQASAAVWMALELLCLALTLPLLTRLGGLSLPRRWFPFIFMAIVGLYPVIDHLRFGQVGIAILLLTCLMLLALQQGQSCRAGILFGLALCLKPVTWPLAVVLLLRREWRALASAALTGAALVATTALVAGPARLLAYVREVLPAVSEIYLSLPANISIWTLGYRTFIGSVDVRPTVDVLYAPPLVAASALARPIAVVMALIVLAAAVWAARSLPQPWDYALLLASSIVINPVAWMHYLVLAFLPATLMIGWLARTGFPSRPTTWALAVALLLLTPYALWDALAFRTFGHLATADMASLSFWLSLLTMMPTMAVVGLCWLLAWVGRRLALGQAVSRNASLVPSGTRPYPDVAD
jgi:hypothetical protein